MSATSLTTTIDHRDNCWFVMTSRGDFGFWSLAAATSFAVNNLRSIPTLSNRAIVQKFKRVA